MGVRKQMFQNSVAEVKAEYRREVLKRNSLESQDKEGRFDPARNRESLANSCKGATQSNLNCTELMVTKDLI
jgi:hypothetical protein